MDTDGPLNEHWHAHKSFYIRLHSNKGNQIVTLQHLPVTLPMFSSVTLHFIQLDNLFSNPMGDKFI